MQINQDKAIVSRRHRRMHTEPLHQPKKRKSLFQIKKKSKYWDIEMSRRVGDEISKHVHYNRRKIEIDLQSPFNYRVMGNLLPQDDDNTEEEEIFSNEAVPVDPILKKLSHDLSIIDTKKSRFGRLLHQIKSPLVLPQIRKNKSFASENFEEKAKKQRLAQMSDFKRQFYYRQRSLLNHQPPLTFLKNELEKKFDQILSDMRD